MLDLSVVIATYSRPSQLRQALESLTRQTLPASSYEVLVVDNGVTAATQSVVSEFTAKHPQWKYLAQSKPGAAAARNAGIRESCGDRVLFLDDDIIADPELLAEHMAVGNKNPEAAILGNVRFPWKGDESAFFCALARHPELYQTFDFQDDQNVSYKYFYTCNLSMPCLFFQKEVPFDETFTASGFEDIELGARFQRHGGKIIYNARASALHNVKIDCAHFLRKRRESGWWLGLLLKKCPQLKDDLFNQKAGWYSMVSIGLGQIGGLFVPLYDSESKWIVVARPFLGRMCWLALQRRFWQGYEDFVRGGSAALSGSSL